MLLVFLTLVSGCGKKAPPVAPRQPAMNAVTDLTARIQDGVVTLAWHYQPSGVAVTGYAVYGAKQTLSVSPCAGCPLLFEKMETVPLAPGTAAERQQLTWSQPVTGGYGYIFKVVPVQSSGAQGPDSNLAKVEALP